MATRTFGDEGGQIEANVVLQRRIFVVGEPIIVRVSIANASASAFLFPGPYSVAYGRHYVVRWRRAEGDWKVAGGRRVGRRSSDLYRFPPRLAPGRRLCAVHLIPPPSEEAEYGLEAVFFEDYLELRRPTARQSESFFQTNEVGFAVQQIPPDDPMGDLTPEQRKKVSRWVIWAHFHGGGSPPPEDIDMDHLVQALLSSDSPFAETVAYAYILNHTTREWRRKEPTKALGVAEEFLRKYPDSWLRAEIYAQLFEVRYAMGEYQAAVEALETGAALEESRPLYDNRRAMKLRAGEAYFRLGRLEDAEVWAGEARLEFRAQTPMGERAQELLENIRAAKELEREHQRSSAPDRGDSESQPSLGKRE
jgi:tetratricopeptide (TPR) repeat protein